MTDLWSDRAEAYRTAPEHREDMVGSVDEALDILEALKPGITVGIEREGLELLYGYAYSVN